MGQMRVEDPTLYTVQPIDIETEDGKFVGLIKAPSGRLVGVMTVPKEDVIAAAERAS